MKKYKTEILLSITTGILLCKFSEMQECCEFLMESPIWTHQFAHRPFYDALKSAVLCQHPQLSGVDANGFGRHNWTEFRDQMIERFGSELSLVPLRLCSKKEMSESFNEPLKGKDVLRVEL